MQYYRRHLSWGETYLARAGRLLEINATDGLLANDRIQGDIRAEIIDEPDAATGSLSSFDPETGAFSFEPAPGLREGTASFTYRLRGKIDSAAPSEVIGNIVRVIIRIHSPELRVSRIGSEIEVAWPIAESAGAVLFESENLKGWIPNEDGIFQAAGWKFIRVSPGSFRKFWSLR